MLPLLAVKGVSKAFGSVRALRGVSLDVSAGEVHCLLGENGAGKSTLCNLIFGLFTADEGEFYLAGRRFAPSKPAEALAAGIAMVHQHFSLVPNMTALENLMLGHGALRLPVSAVRRRLEELTGAYGLAVDSRKTIETMSIGERQRVEIIKCLFDNPKLLLLDEPTAVLPPDEVESLLGICRAVAGRGHGVVLVTHKLVEIAKVADRVTVLRAGRAVETVKMQQASVPSLVRSMIGADISETDSVLAATVGATEKDVPTPHAPPTGAPATPGRTDGRMAALEVSGLSLLDEAGVLRLSDVSLTVRRGEIVGIAGVEGNGQTQLGEIVAGMVAPTAGRLVINGVDVTGSAPRRITAAGAGIVPEDRHTVGCIPEMTVAENLYLGFLDRFSRFGFLDRSELRAEAARLLEQFDVVGQPGDLMVNLSGGNQQKVVLARELSLPNLALLVAALPTRGLDIKATHAVYARMREARDRGVGVLLISNELDELIAVANRVLVIYRGRIVGEKEATPGNREAIGALMSGHLAAERDRAAGAASRYDVH